MAVAPAPTSMAGAPQIWGPRRVGRGEIWGSGKAAAGGWAGVAAAAVVGRSRRAGRAGVRGGSPGRADQGETPAMPVKGKERA